MDGASPPGPLSDFAERGRLDSRITQAYVEVTYRTAGDSTVYIGGVYEKSFTAAGALAGSRNYYAALGRAIAVRDVPAGGGAGTLAYLLADHLVCTSLITTTDMRIVERRTYWPFGGERTETVTGAQRTDLLYTGQREEADDASSLGLYNYKARFYSTTLGRFVSADPVAPRESPLNRYSYVANNPLRWSDPTGHVPTVPQDESSPLSACAGDIAGCLFWANAGDYAGYIYDVARHFQISPFLLSAIILNEMAHINARDLAGDTGARLFDKIQVPGGVPVIGGETLYDFDQNTWGIAQILPTTAQTVEGLYGIPTSGSIDETIDRLENPMYATAYAAAILHDAEVNFVPDDRRGSEIDLTVAYHGQGSYEQWLYNAEPGGCATCGNRAPGWIADVNEHLHSGSVRELDVKLDEADPSWFPINGVK